MGYTIEKGKIVIWTEKIFMADDYPFQSEGENHTFFYKNLKDRQHFKRCVSAIPEAEKTNLVSMALNIPEDKIILKSKKSHNNKKKNAGV